MSRGVGGIFGDSLVEAEPRVDGGMGERSLAADD